MDDNIRHPQQPQPDSGMILDYMVRADIEECADIDRECFDHWWDADRIVSITRKKDIVGKVVRDFESEIVLGFMMYQISKEHITLARIAVHPDNQRDGVGTFMAKTLLGKFTGLRTEIDVVVPETMLGALQFFKAIGWLATEVVKTPYEKSPDIDGIRMAIKEMQTAGL